MACPFSHPHRLFADLGAIRNAPGIPFSEKLKGFTVTRYDDIATVLDQPEVFSSYPTVPEFPPPVRDIFGGKVPDRGTLLGYDNPDHDRLRASATSFFVPRRLQRFEPVIRKHAHALIDGFISSGEIELKSEFALPLPLKMIVTIVGLDHNRWEWIRQCLALFGGITRFENASIERKIKDVLDLHKYVASVIEERRTDRRDDLVSHIWNERDSGAVNMTDFEHLAVIPGLMLAGHETTTNMLCMGLAHLLQRDLWTKASQDSNSISRAAEELLRYESVVTGMPRLVKEATIIGGQSFEPGGRLFVAYNAGSRDPSRFTEPDYIRLDRKFSTQHLAFGRGVHACLGAPLARIILRTEFSVLRERLPNIRLLTNYEELPYDFVHEARGIHELRIAWDPPTQRPVSFAHEGLRVATEQRGQVSDQSQSVLVKAMTTETPDNKILTLAPINNTALPPWTPGAHIDLQVGNIGYRQYSLCSSPEEPSCWQVAVLREDTGRGGSRYIHDSLREGMQLTVRGPRNHFLFEPAKHHLLIAGGIGITPIKPMLDEARKLNLDYRLIYLGRTRKTLAFMEELERNHPTLVWTREEHGKRLDLSSILTREAGQDGFRVYCCGPDSLVQEVEDSCASFPPGTLRVERFVNSKVPSTHANTDFDVILNRSKRKIKVRKDESLLETLRENGCDILSTCATGICGTCEVRVVNGLPDHRDAVLTAEERAENKCMMVCVSRCLGEELTLDLW